MRKFTAIVLVLIGAFAGGAFAQTIGGNMLSTALAAVTQVFAATGTLTVAGDNSQPNNSPIFQNITANGTATGNPQGINYLHITDNVNGGTALSSGFMLRQQLSGTQGNRYGVMGYLSVDGMPSGSDTSLQNYVAVEGQGYSTTPAQSGLTGGASFGAGKYAGNYWGSNFNAWLGASGGPNATNWQGLYGSELDTQIFSGSSVAERYTLLLNNVGGPAVIDDAFIEVTGDGNTTNGIEFGGVRHGWPIPSTGSIMTAIVRSQGGTSSPVALYGVDLSAVTFSAGGAPFLAPLITPASSAATCKQGSIEWDASFIYICTASNTWKRATLAAF